MIEYQGMTRRKCDAKDAGRERVAALLVLLADEVKKPRSVNRPELAQHRVILDDDRADSHLIYFGRLRLEAEGATF